MDHWTGLHWAGAISLAATVWFCFNVLVPIKPRHRGKAFGLALISFMVFAMTASINQDRIDSKLARLRETDVDAYLALYKEHHTVTQYATELRLIDPARWERELPEIQALADAERKKSGALEGTAKEVQAKLKETQPQWNEETRRQIWIVQGQDAVRQKLKDSESAKFRKVGISNKSGQAVSCGEVNSRNSFGGFTGFQRYVSAGVAEFTFLEEEVEDFDVLWAKMCG